MLKKQKYVTAVFCLFLSFFFAAMGILQYQMIRGKKPVSTDAGIEAMNNDTVLVGGMPIGIYMETDGVMVLNTEQIAGADGKEHEPAKGIVKAGDYIMAVDHCEITGKKELLEAVGNLTGTFVVLTVRRNGETIDLKIKPVEYETGEYRLGIWVRDNVQGLGTVTFLTDQSRFGAALAIAGLVILIVRAVHTGSPMRIVTFSIYGAALVLFFLASTLFHSLIFTRARRVFQILDHDMIYLVIAASYTPYCLVAIKGWQGWTLFGIIWAMAIAGIIYKSIWFQKKSKWSTIFYVIMGWMCVLAFWPLWHALGPVGFGLLLAGGITYTLGALLYSMPTRYTHLIWHLFVMVGTAFIYFSILFYV